MGLIGSCTNSSYEDMARAVSIVNQAVEHGIILKAEFGVNPGSEQIRFTIERDGMIAAFEKWGLKYFKILVDHALRQWDRAGADKQEKKYNCTFFLIVTSLNEQMVIQIHMLLSSPEMVAALAIAGRLDFNPLRIPY
jgi:aconitate hydratase